MCNMQNYNCRGISFYACKTVLSRSNEDIMLLQNSNQQICEIREDNVFSYSNSPCFDYKFSFFNMSFNIG